MVFRTFWPTWISVICLEKLRDWNLGPIRAAGWWELAR